MCTRGSVAAPCTGMRFCDDFLVFFFCARAMPRKKRTSPRKVAAPPAAFAAKQRYAPAMVPVGEAKRLVLADEAFGESLLPVRADRHDAVIGADVRMGLGVGAERRLAAFDRVRRLEQ